MRRIARRHPKGKDLHIPFDEHSAHKTQENRDWLAARPYIHFPFTPNSASWLNSIAGWLPQRERLVLYRGAFSSVPELEAELMTFIEVDNRVPAKPFTWARHARTILAAFDRAGHALPNPRCRPLVLRQRALPVRLVERLRVTELTTWPTSV